MSKKTNKPSAAPASKGKTPAKKAPPASRKTSDALSAPMKAALAAVAAMSPKGKSPRKRQEPESPNAADISSIGIGDPALAEQPEAGSNRASWPTGSKPRSEAKQSKLNAVTELLLRPEGATVDDMVAATGWQKHTVRACLSHALAKKRGYKIVSDKPQGGQRIYKITGIARSDEVAAKDDH